MGEATSTNLHLDSRVASVFSVETFRSHFRQQVRWLNSCPPHMSAGHLLAHIVTSGVQSGLTPQDLGVCWAMSALLALWTYAVVQGPSCPVLSLAWVIDRCRLPFFYGAGCGGGDPAEVLR